MDNTGVSCLHIFDNKKRLPFAEREKYQYPDKTKMKLIEEGRKFSLKDCAIRCTAEARGRSSKKGCCEYDQGTKECYFGLGNAIQTNTHDLERTAVLCFPGEKSSIFIVLK